MKEDPGFGKTGELLLSLLIDAIGMASYLVPGIGEATDIATAPMNLFWIKEMFNDLDGEDGQVGNALAVGGGIEELAPFIDVIPSATIAWSVKWQYYKK